MIRNVCAAVALPDVPVGVVATRGRIAGSPDNRMKGQDMRRLMNLIAAASVIGLGACSGSNSDLERAVVGAAIGCAAGQVLVDGRCVEGALVGAGVAVLTN